MNILDIVKKHIKKIPLLQANVTSLIQGKRYFGIGLPSNINTDFTKRSIDIIKLLTNEKVLSTIDCIVLPDKEAFEAVKESKNYDNKTCNKILSEIANNERIYIEETMKLFGIEKPVKLFSELVDLKKYNKVLEHIKNDIRNQPQILWQAYKTLSEKNKVSYNISQYTEETIHNISEEELSHLFYGLRESITILTLNASKLGGRTEDKYIQLSEVVKDTYPNLFPGIDISDIRVKITKSFEENVRGYKNPIPYRFVEENDPRTIPNQPSFDHVDKLIEHYGRKKVEEYIQKVLIPIIDKRRNYVLKDAINYHIAGKINNYYKTPIYQEINKEEVSKMNTAAFEEYCHTIDWLYNTYVLLPIDINVAERKESTLEERIEIFKKWEDNIFKHLSFCFSPKTFKSVIDCANKHYNFKDRDWDFKDKTHSNDILKIFWSTHKNLRAIATMHPQLLLQLSQGEINHVELSQLEKLSTNLYEFVYKEKITLPYHGFVENDDRVPQNEIPKRVLKAIQDAENNSIPIRNSYSEIDTIKFK